MSLSLDTTFLTNVCEYVGEAHNAYIRAVGGNREDDDGGEGGPFYWFEAVKSVCRGGNDLQTGLPVGTDLVVAAQGSPDDTVDITGGNVTVNGETVAVVTNTTYGSSTIFTQTCTDGSALTAGQFYDCALCVDHLGTKTVFRGPREDRPDTETRPQVPSGYARLATIRVRYSATTSVIQTADITAGFTLTSFSAPSNDVQARMFNDFDAGQTKMISRSAVKNELGFAFKSLNRYVKAITATQGLGGGLGIELLAWAKSTHQTNSPWDFPSSFIAFIRVLKGGKDPSQRLATIDFTAGSTATVTDLKKVVGRQDRLELVVVSASATGSAESSISVTTQSYGDATAIVWHANVPESAPNGTVIPLKAIGTAALQSPLVGTAINTAITASTILDAQPTVTQTIWTALVPTAPVVVVGGTNGDNFAVRNVGTL